VGAVSTPARSREVVIAVDGGGSKTDVVVIGVDGGLVSHARGPGTNPQVIGLPVALGILDTLRAEALAGYDDALVVRSEIYLAGLDLPAEISAAREALAHWDAAIVDNDLFALLRGGTQEQDAVAVVCGTGINAIAVRRDGATARFPALGEISGDWGGGSYLGGQALWHAARAADGRGPSTSLEHDVPLALGLASVREVIEAIHFGRLDDGAVGRLSPVLFEAASAGDVVAQNVVDRQAEEIVTMAVTALTKLDLLAAPVPVVLGGGVLAAGHPRLLAGIDRGLRARAPLAETHVVTAPPLLGAGLLALEGASAPESALARYRAEVSTRVWVPATVEQPRR
jgi:N-acetylglucosamine kinase-like BadF-type ATPase